MKKNVTKLLLWILITVLSATVCFACDEAPDTVRSSVGETPQNVTSNSEYDRKSNRDDVTFTEMTYERPDIDGMRAQMDDLRDGIDRGKPADEMIAAYETLRAEYAHADSMLSLAYLLYAFDVTEPYYRNEYSYLQTELSILDADMESVSIELFESSGEAEQLARESFGEGYVETILSDDFGSEESVQELLDAEEQKTLQYDELNATYTLLDNGTRWTLDAIFNDPSLDYDEYYRLYNAYCAGLNESAGKIFLEQLKIREQIARRLGYDNYAAYCYDAYGRDYSLADAVSLQQAVKRYIVPVFVEANYRNDTYDLADAEFDEQEFLSKLETAAADFSPMLDESLQYMLRNNLYDFSVSTNKMDTSFTTHISDYNAPFIFSEWGGHSDDILTTLHELGHFTNYYHNAEVGYSASDNLDLAEIDSQALVLLMIDYYDSFFGKLSDEAVADVLIDAMYSLISGCMEDEFQQTIYKNPDMTLSEINALYQELAVEYGLDEVYGYEGTEWVLISHTFQTPMYYISYAVSMVPALELFEESQSDPVAARAAYFAILNRDQYAQLQSVLLENGLAPVFSEATIKRIATLLEQRT